MNPNTKEQRYFLGHNEDIVSLAVHPNKKIAATGQRDPKGHGLPYICVWDIATCKELARLEQAHERAIPALAFSPDGKHLISVGDDDAHTAKIWDWEAGLSLHSFQVSKDQVFSIATAGADTPVYQGDDQKGAVKGRNQHI
jgi:WD40 repeat protein